MDLSNVEAIDSFILLSILNEKLRIECDSLAELTQTYEMDVDQCHRQIKHSGLSVRPFDKSI